LCSTTCAKPVGHIRSLRSRAKGSGALAKCCACWLPFYLVNSPKATRVESDDLPPEVMIGDVPNWAVDLYTREGRAAFARFLETDALAARWVRGSIRPARRVSLLAPLHCCFPNWTIGPTLSPTL
jgi:hypothetical protein